MCGGGGGGGALIPSLHIPSLYKHADIQLCHPLQDTDGKTPLHSAVFSHRRKAIAMLLEGGADPALLNFRLFTPVHNATGFGFLA